jgi:hypothetical protein
MKGLRFNSRRLMYVVLLASTAIATYCLCLRLGLPYRVSVVIAFSTWPVIGGFRTLFE